MAKIEIELRAHLTRDLWEDLPAGAIIHVDEDDSFHTRALHGFREYPRGTFKEERPRKRVVRGAAAEELLQS